MRVVSLFPPLSANTPHLKVPHLEVTIEGEEGQYQGPMGKRDLKSKIKEWAAEIEIDGIAFAGAGPLEDTKKAFKVAIDRGFIPARSASRDSTLHKLTTPTRHLSGARSVISAYQSYFTGEPASSDPLRGTIAAYTRSNHYEDLRRRLRRLAGLMERDFGCRAKAFSCYVTLAEKPLAQRAGLGFYGKNGVIVTPGHGSYVVLGEILTDLVLEPDETLSDTCGDCNLCIRACPTGAIKRPYFVDRTSCIQYLSERPGVLGRRAMDHWANRLYGCTDCQDVCPYNSGIPPTSRVVSHGSVGSSIPLKEILTISNRDFSARFSDNQIGMRERNAIRRNALIAAGNSGSDTLLPLLRTCAADDDPVIRFYSLWAISMIEGTSTRPFDEAVRRFEAIAGFKQDEDVLKDLKTLLDGFDGVE
jgi:epoxyqueuosine reductase